MGRPIVAVALLILVLAQLASADAACGAGSSFCERVLERLLASPLFPLAGQRVLSDEMSMHVSVAEGTVVRVDAAADPGAVFVLHFARDGQPDEASPIPGFAQSALLAPGEWSVAVDPVAGAQVRIVTDFRGYVSDVGGRPAAFGFHDISVDRGCVTQDVCLP